MCAIPYAPKEKGASLSGFRLACAGIAVLGLGGIVSVGSSYDPYEHLSKVIKLAIALSGIVGLTYVLANRKIVTLTAALTVLCVSATTSSAICLLQGKFHILTGLIPKDLLPKGVMAWSRMTGLAEGPIEAGEVADFGTIIAIGLAIYTRRWILLLPLIAINLYSFTESASLTALLALIVAFGALCAYAKTYKLMIYGIAVSIAVAVLASALDARRLTGRIDSLLRSENNYVTIQSRELQWKKSIELIEPRTLLIGNGYATADLPYHLDIHNGMIASIFHFGILGLIGQCLLIAFFLTRLGHTAPLALKSTLLGCLVIFALAYMTGPALSRRSLWVAPMILSAYLTTLRTPPAFRHQSGAHELGATGKRTPVAIPG
jgi:hypothetical protein